MPPKSRGRRAQRKDQKYGSSVTDPPPSRNGKSSALAGDTASQLASAEMLARRAARFSAVPPNNRYLQMKDQRHDLRDAYIRAGKIQDITKPVTLEEAITLVGECEDMCPEFERHEREFQKNVHKLEMIPGTKSIDHKLAVKTFHRPAAGDLQPLPSDVRPPPVLKKTLDYLIDKVLAETPLEECHHFIRDRTRSIRQDFTLQNFKGAETVDACERIARFHILSAHEMCEVPEFSVQQEIEQMRKVLITLMELYTDNRTAGKPPYPNEKEFRAYYMLTHIHDPNVAKDTDNLPMDILYSLPMLFSRYFFECVRLAKEAYERRPKTVAAALQMSSTLFRALASPDIPYLVCCVIESNFASFREAAFQAINYAASRNRERITVSALYNELGYNSPEQLVEDLKDNGIPVLHDHGELALSLPQKDEDGQVYLRLAGRTLFETQHEFFSRPQGLTLTDIVNGEAGTLPKSAARMMRNAFLECCSQPEFERTPFQHDFPKQLDPMLEAPILSDGNADSNCVDMEPSPLSASSTSNSFIPATHFPSFSNTAFSIQPISKPTTSYWNEHSLPHQATSINFSQGATPPVTFKWAQPFPSSNTPVSSKPLTFGSNYEQSPSASSNGSGIAFSGPSAFHTAAQPMQSSTNFYLNTVSPNLFPFIAPSNATNLQSATPFVNYSTSNVIQPTLPFTAPAQSQPPAFAHTTPLRKPSWDIAAATRSSQPSATEFSFTPKPTWITSSDAQAPYPSLLSSATAPLNKSPWKVTTHNLPSHTPTAHPAATTPQYQTGVGINNGMEISSPHALPSNAAGNGEKSPKHRVPSGPMSAHHGDMPQPTSESADFFPITFGSIPATAPSRKVSTTFDNHENQAESEESSMNQATSSNISEKSSSTPLPTSLTPPEGESSPEAEEVPSETPPATESEDEERTLESDKTDRTMEEEPKPQKEKRATWHDVWEKIGSNDLKENAPLLPVNFTPKRNVDGLVSAAFQAGTGERLALWRKQRGEDPMQEQRVAEMCSQMSKSQNNGSLHNANGTVPSKKGKGRQASQPVQAKLVAHSERRVQTNTDCNQPLDLHRLVRNRIEPHVRGIRHGRETSNGRDVWKLLVCVDSQRKEALDYCVHKFRAGMENTPASVPDDLAYRTCARVSQGNVDAEFAMVDGLSLRPGMKSAKPAAFENAAALIFQLRECTASKDLDVFWEEERLRLGSFLARIPNDGLPLLVLAHPLESACQGFGPSAYQKLDLAGLQANGQLYAAEVAVIPLTPSKQSDAMLYQFLETLVSVSKPNISSNGTLDQNTTNLEGGWAIKPIGPNHRSPTSRRARRFTEWQVRQVRTDRKRDRRKKRDARDEVEEAVETLRAAVAGVRSELNKV